MSKKQVGITRKETYVETMRRKRNEKIVALRHGGHSFGEIAQIIGVDKATAYRICRFGKNSPTVYKNRSRTVA